MIKHINVNAAYLINQIAKLHPRQYTLPASIFMAIRARLEFKAGFNNRIGRVYPHGNRHVLIVGKAGTGKTRLLRAIYEGLGLDGVNAQGQQVGKWVSSAGASTGVGIFETLEVYNDSIIFIDEISMDTTAHLHVLKQISNGEIMRPRHENINPTPFTGLVLTATNAITLSRNQGNALEHLLSVLDRFTVVKACGSLMNPIETMDTVLRDSQIGQANINCDWTAISIALTRKTEVDLNKDEETILQKTWSEKSKEILDNTRPQFRNSWTALDIFLFVKRFLGINDITKSLEAIKLAQDMVNDCIIFNPINILWLNPLEEVIYEEIARKSVASIQEIMTICERSGQLISHVSIYKILNRMIINRVICRSDRGKYSVKINKDQVSITEQPQPTEIENLIKAL